MTPRRAKRRPTAVPRAEDKSMGWMEWELIRDSVVESLWTIDVEDV